MNATQVFLFGWINNLCKLLCVYAYNVFTEVVAAAIGPAKYILFWHKKLSYAHYSLQLQAS